MADLPDPNPDPEPGDRPAWLAESRERMGRYLLGPSLGKGGMGEVFEAWDSFLCRRVALKVLHFSEIRTVTRFMREAQLQAKVHHPNLCQIFDVDEAEGRPFIAMQLVRGPSLEQLAGGLGRHESIWALMQVAEAVHAAHRVKLVHRDLKPSNILLEKDAQGKWNPVVCDFGLAMEVGDLGLTLSQAFIGTPAFMAPEQIRGDRSLVGPASDVYALGATLYRVLLGRPTYLAEGGQDLLDVKLNQAFPRPRMLRTDLSPDLEIILLKCLEPDPLDRYASAAALAEDLRRVMDGEPIVARPLGLLGHARRAIRRNPAFTIAVIVLGILALAGLGWGQVVRVRSRAQVELAQRFGAVAKDIEYAFRMERLLPPHDLRPLRERVARQMNEIHLAIRADGEPAKGPARLALARGYLTQRNLVEAHRELQLAWDAGYRGAESSQALARAHLESFAAKADRETLELGDESLDALRVRHLVAARNFLTQSIGGDEEVRTLITVTLLNFEGYHEQALPMARNLAAVNPWLYEARLQEASALVGIGFRAQMTGRFREARECYALAEAALESALNVGRSDESIYMAILNFQLARLGSGDLSGWRNTIDWTELSALVDRALSIDPENQRFIADKLTLACRKAEYLIQAGRDPSVGIGEALTMIERIRNVPECARIAAQKEAWLYELKAAWAFITGQDAEDALQRAWSSGPKGLVAAQVAADLAAHFVRTGRDPAPWVNQIEAACKKSMLWDHQQGMVLLAARGHSQQALWQHGNGGNPVPELEESKRLMDSVSIQSVADPWAQGIFTEWCAASLKTRNGAGRDRLREGETSARSVLASPASSGADLWRVAQFGLEAEAWARRNGEKMPQAVSLGRKAAHQGRKRFPLAHWPE